MSRRHVTAPRRDAPGLSDAFGAGEEIDSSVKDGDRDVLLDYNIRTAKQLTRRVNHDFNNLISVVRGYASILQGNPRLDEDSKQVADLIEQAGAELAGLTDRLACFADPPPHAPAKLSLNQLVDEFLGLKKSNIPEGVDLEIALADSLPELLADRARLLEMCGHLWHNAIESMPHGGKLVWQTDTRPDTRATGSKRDSKNSRLYLRLRVSDSGQGMDEKALASVFTPFFTTKPGKGRGLGATVVYEIVKSHGGYLEVSTGAGPGSCIDLYLPSSGDPGNLPRGEAGTGHHGSAPILLVVDDDDMVRLAIQRMLEHLGYGAIAAASGEEALEIYERSGAEIAAIILDVTMPGLGGIETFRRLQAMDSEVRVIVTSGDPLNPAIRELEVEEISYLIAKPFHTEHLARAIQHTIG